MSEPVKCERRFTCTHNLDGQCTLENPRLDKRSAYTSCIDQKKPVETVNP